jgi:DNA-binding transcriptional LysR family regulator
MTLRELRYLVAIADHGHFGRAAEACHISQPTLSTQLKKLEDSLGVVLFERTNKALSVTPIGRKIVDQARKVLAEADALIELSRDSTAPLSGPLTLGVIPTLGPYLLPWLVPLLKQAFSALRLILNEDLTDNLIERLRAHRIDAAVVALPIEGGDLESRPLFDEPFCFACPRDHPLACSKMISDADLRSQPLLLLTDGHCLREIRRWPSAASATGQPGRKTPTSAPPAWRPCASWWRRAWAARCCRPSPSVRTGRWLSGHWRTRQDAASASSGDGPIPRTATGTCLRRGSAPACHRPCVPPDWASIDDINRSHSNNRLPQANIFPNTSP